VHIFRASGDGLDDVVALRAIDLDAVVGRDGSLQLP
jgi:hypothetical protein